MTDIVISETFGPTIQGEGPSTGRPALFIRLGLCNLDCKWCDTPFTWDWTGKNGVAYDREVELETVTVESLVEWATSFDTATVVISGGEPLVQAGRTAELARQLLAAGKRVEIETNGTRSPTDRFADIADDISWNVSPKLWGSGVDLEKSLNFNTLSEFVRLPNAVFKFVITEPDDEMFAWDVVAHTGMPNDRVYLMPEGVSAESVNANLPGVIDLALKHNYNVTTRVHVQAYGNRRGV